MVVSSTLIVTSVAAAYEVFARFSAGQQQQTVQIIQQGSSLQVSQSGSSSSSQVQTPTGYVFVTAVSALAGRASAYFNHPTQGTSLLINASGQWKAFGATCTHQPCTVQYGGSSIDCPCHGASFSLSNGSVLRGPAQRPLPEFGVLVQNGNLFATTSTIN